MKYSLLRLVLIKTMPISYCSQFQVYSPSKIAQVIKSITAREIFKRVPDVKKQLWEVDVRPSLTPVVDQEMKMQLQNM